MVDKLTVGKKKLNFLLPCVIVVIGELINFNRAKVVVGRIKKQGLEELGQMWFTWGCVAYARSPSNFVVKSNLYTTSTLPTSLL